jgi:predicted HAD superfamily phosphohydrolase YqeG
LHHNTKVNKILSMNNPYIDSKTLIIDLDETLIHCKQMHEEGEAEV